MSQPLLTATYPANNDVGIPTGQPITLTFDRGVDLITAKTYIVLYGSDFDQTSGAESQLWVDADTGNNPFFLRSPGFKGLVDLRIEASYVDLDSGATIDFAPDSEIEEASYGVAGAGHKLTITPAVGTLAPDTEYTLHIIGDPDVTNTTGISSRTVFETNADPGNTSTTGTIVFYGSYTGSSSDTINVRITTAGDIGTAKYKWWFTSEGEGSATIDKLSNRRYRLLSNGLQVRFSGTNFEVGDLFTANVEPMQRLATSTKIVFTTNDGSYTTAPDSPSTPATSEPPESTIPPVPGAPTTTEALQVLEVSPPDGSYNISTKTRTITIIFSENLDATTVDNASVHIYKYPVLGWWQGMPEPVELAKKITVSGQVMTIEV